MLLYVHGQQPKKYDWRRSKIRPTYVRKFSVGDGLTTPVFPGNTKLFRGKPAAVLAESTVEWGGRKSNFGDYLSRRFWFNFIRIYLRLKLIRGERSDFEETHLIADFLNALF